MAMFEPKGLAQNAENAKNVASLINSDKLVMEAKYDGFRILAHVHDGGQVTIYTRTGNSKAGYAPHIEYELSKLPDGTWLDGELCVFNEDGTNKWGAVQSVMGANLTADQVTKSACLSYVIFDCIAWDNLDVRPLSLTKRREILDVIFSEFDMAECLRMAEQYPASDQLHDEFVAKGYEGTIVKDPTARYASGKRGGGWWKLKASDTLDCVIMGFQDGKDGFSGMVGAIIFGQYVDGVLTERGKCSGMTMAVRADMSLDERSYIGKVIELAHMGIMESGKVRHPQYKGMRDDKPAEECHWIS